MALPLDSHVHTEWSWDAEGGSMERTCERAIEIGLPAVAFTEHADLTTWVVEPGHLTGPVAELVTDEGTFTPTPLDVEGYLECLQRCRDRFPGLRIMSGVELGEPHAHAELATELLAAGGFERVLGSVHSLGSDAGSVDAPMLYRTRKPAEVVRAYLDEVMRLVNEWDEFSVLTHIDYPLRYLPPEGATLGPEDFESEYRAALRVLAGTGRALEVNTKLPLHPRIVRWWREEGGEAVSFGSDAHDPEHLAHGFTDAAEMVESVGFKPGRHPCDFWHLVRGR